MAFERECVCEALRCQVWGVWGEIRRWARVIGWRERGWVRKCSERGNSGGDSWRLVLVADIDKCFMGTHQ